MKQKTKVPRISQPINPDGSLYENNTHANEQEDKQDKLLIAKTISSAFSSCNFNLSDCIHDARKLMDLKVVWITDIKQAVQLLKDKFECSPEHMDYPVVTLHKIINSIFGSKLDGC